MISKACNGFLRRVAFVVKIPISPRYFSATHFTAHFPKPVYSAFHDFPSRLCIAASVMAQSVHDSCGNIGELPFQANTRRIPPYFFRLGSMLTSPMFD